MPLAQTTIGVFILVLVSRFNFIESFLLKKMKLLILFILFLTLTGCGIILINENNYRALKETDKKSIKPYDFNATQYNRIKNEELYVYEIDSKDIKENLKQSKFTWIHLWRPFCQAPTCQNINVYSEIEKDYKNKGLSLLFISESYDIQSIKKIVTNIGFQKNIFVLQDAYYGHKSRKNRVKLFHDLNNNQFKATKYGVDDFLFKDTLLIYAGHQLNKKVIDSVLTNLK
jgi:hypothetical protein